MSLEEHDEQVKRIRFAQAIDEALSLHRDQVRKGTVVRYVSHLLAVAAMVMEYGGDYELAVAAALHDAVEDAGVSLDRIRTLYGARVADVVEACTDTPPEHADPTAKAPWRERKERALTKLRTCSADAAIVAACDRLHNLRSQIADLRHTGATVKFNAPLEDRLWAAWASADALADKLPPRLHEDLLDATALWEAYVTTKADDA